MNHHPIPPWFVHSMGKSEIGNLWMESLIFPIARNYHGRIGDWEEENQTGCVNELETTYPRLFGSTLAHQVLVLSPLVVGIHGNPSGC